MRKTDLFQTRGFPSVAVGNAGFLACRDARVFLGAVRSAVADVVFLDPPFNLGKRYGLAAIPESLPADKYEEYLREVLRESIRILRPGGALFLYHLPKWASKLADLLHSELIFRHWIAVAMKNGFARGKYLYPAHYALLYFSKGNPREFKRPRIDPLRCPECDAVVRDYGGYRKIIDAKGLNLSDFWEDLSPVRHKGQKLRRGNQLPQELTDRVVAIAGSPGGLLADPFSGTGTALASAASVGMYFAGNDLDAAAVRISEGRVREALKVRATRRRTGGR